VETLKLGWCHVGSGDGAKAVADLLMFNSTLVTLDLRGNGLGNAGAAELARALKAHTNDKLVELDLGYNEIKDEGACTLAQVGGLLPCVTSGDCSGPHTIT
jgi:Ran GTPase-activating protein (RanGAP) involved in mRNA processing and transport